MVDKRNRTSQLSPWTIRSGSRHEARNQNNVSPSSQSSYRRRSTLRERTVADESASTADLPRCSKNYIHCLCSSFALLGDSFWALAFSFLLLVVSIFIALHLNDDGGDMVPNKNATDRPFATYESLGPLPYVERPPRIYRVGTVTYPEDHHSSTSRTPLLFQPTKEMRLELERDGYKELAA